MKLQTPLTGLLIISLFAGPAHAQTTFFEETWEANNFNQWKQPVHSRTNIINDNSNYPGGRRGVKAVQSLYRKGTIDGGGFGLIKLGGFFLPPHFRVEFAFKFSSPFTCPMWQKMWRASTDMSGNGTPGIDNYTDNELGSCANFQVLYISRSSAFGMQHHVLNTNVGSLTLNTWHKIAYEYKKNTFTGSEPNSDGEIKVYFRDQLIGTKSDIRLTANPTTWLRDFWGGPGNYTSRVNNRPIVQDQWITVDNFRIIDLASPSPSPMLPVAPAGLP
ncbi:MAG: hypothetical protein ACREQP_12470 [Candidatus Binatia bacterium]